MIQVVAVGADKVRRNLERAGQEIMSSTLNNVRLASLLVLRYVREQMSAPGVHDPFWGRKGLPGPTPFLSVRSGQTRARTVASPPFRLGNTVTASVGSPDKHVAQLERGGVVQGKQFLRIPTGAAQTASGQDRYAGQSIRNIPGAFLLRTKQGRLWAVQAPFSNLPGPGRRGRSARLGLKFLYLLVRKITLKPRPVFAFATARAQPQVVRLFSGSVTMIVARANT